MQIENTSPAVEVILTPFFSEDRSCGARSWGSLTSPKPREAMKREESEWMRSIAYDGPGAHHLDVLRQTEQRQQSDSPVVEIYFPPGHAMACGHGMRMVVIVPAFASG